MTGEELADRLMRDVAKNIRNRAKTFNELYDISAPELQKIAERLEHISNLPRQG